MKDYQPVSKMENNDKLPIDVALDVSELLDVDQVIVLARDRDTGNVRHVTYGKTFVDSGMAAMDGEKIAAMLRASPTSLDDAVAAAAIVRPGDISVENTVRGMEVDTDGVHRTHCCELHGCKYADDKCPVVNGKIQQDYLCELCDIEGYKSIHDLNKTISLRKKIAAATDDILCLSEPTEHTANNAAVVFCKFIVEMRMQYNLRNSERQAIGALLGIEDIKIISPEFVNTISKTEL